jgi:hypothetical protein
MSDQLVVKSKFCCNVKFVEGMIHESWTLLFEEIKLNTGEGVIWEV